MDWGNPYPANNLHLAICDDHTDRIFVPAVALIIIAELTGEAPYVADTIRQTWGATSARYTNLPNPARARVLLGLRALYERGLHGWDDDWTFGDEVFSYAPIPLPDAA